jgi:endonuclease/exonuclease/phosphatase family metal-dependent hydrolase
MRVCTWNLWWRFGPWEERQPAIEATLHTIDADIVCLQEVWAIEDGQDQGALLADALGLHLAHVPQRFWEGSSLRNAVLSRWPVADAEVVQLDGGHRVRHASVARLDTPAGAVTAISAHFDHRFDASAQRCAQARSLAGIAAERRTDDGFPVLIGADLNAVPDSDEVRSLTGRAAPAADGIVFTDAWEVAGEGPGWTWDPANPYLVDAAWPRRRLDYLLVSWPRPKGIGKVERCRLAGTAPVDDAMPSDHYAVVADLRVS